VRADLRFGKTIFGKPSDLWVLRYEQAAGVLGASPRSRPVPGARDGRARKNAELPTKRSREPARRRACAPFAVSQPGAGELDRATVTREPLDRLADTPAKLCGYTGLCLREVQCAEMAAAPRIRAV
jgi:hypothetical protein